MEGVVVFFLEVSRYAYEIPVNKCGLQYYGGGTKSCRGGLNIIKEVLIYLGDVPM